MLIVLHYIPFMQKLTWWDLRMWSGVTWYEDSKKPQTTPISWLVSRYDVMLIVLHYNIPFLQKLTWRDLRMWSGVTWCEDSKKLQTAPISWLVFEIWRNAHCTALYTIFTKVDLMRFEDVVRGNLMRGFQKTHKSRPYLDYFSRNDVMLIVLHYIPFSQKLTWWNLRMWSGVTLCEDSKKLTNHAHILISFRDMT